MPAPTCSSSCCIRLRISPTRSLLIRRTPSLMRRPSSCSGCGGGSCPHGRVPCGGCCPKDSPDRRLRTTSPSCLKSAKVADPARRPSTVGDLVHSRVVTTSPDSPVAEAAAAMVREKVGSALVMQGPFLAGILTERDVLKAAASGSDLTTLPVSAWMTKDPQSADPDTPVEEAAQIMLLNGFRHLPIMQGRQVRGIVTLRDLFAARISRPPQQRGPAA